MVIPLVTTAFLAFRSSLSPLLSFAQLSACSSFIFPLLFFSRLQRALWTWTGTLNLIHRRLELDRTTPQFPSLPPSFSSTRPSSTPPPPVLACLLNRRRICVLDSPTPCYRYIVAFVDDVHQLTLLPPPHTFVWLLFPSSTLTQEAPSMGILFRPRLRWSRHSFTRLSFVSLACPAFLSFDCRCTYLNEQSTTIIVATQGLFFSILF